MYREWRLHGLVYVFAAVVLAYCGFALAAIPGLLALNTPVLGGLVAGTLGWGVFALDRMGHGLSGTLLSPVRRRDIWHTKALSGLGAIAAGVGTPVATFVITAVHFQAPSPALPPANFGYDLIELTVFLTALCASALIGNPLYAVAGALIALWWPAIPVQIVFTSVHLVWPHSFALPMFICRLAPPRSTTGFIDGGPGAHILSAAWLGTWSIAA